VNNKKLLQLLMSAVITFGIWQLYLKAKEENQEMALGMVEVISAGRVIPSQKPIASDWITVKQVPARFVQPGAFREKVKGLHLKKIIGKTTSVTLPEGAQLTQAMLRTPRVETPGVAIKLGPGQRGFLLRLGNLDIAKLILPGDRVDILATFTVRAPGEEKTSRATYTILQNIAVISVGVNVVDASRDEKQETREERVLTLALSPQEAQKLSHTQVESQGEISIVVRAHGDDRQYRLPAVTTSHLATTSPVPAAGAPTR